MPGTPCGAKSGRGAWSARRRRGRGEEEEEEEEEEEASGGIERPYAFLRVSHECLVPSPSHSLETRLARAKSAERAHYECIG
jgi:hypothetical protein